jgi:hypothetical protein
MVNECFTGAQAAPAASGYARSIDAVFGKKDMTGFLIVTALGLSSGSSIGTRTNEMAQFALAVHSPIW